MMDRISVSPSSPQLLVAGEDGELFEDVNTYYPIYHPGRLTL